MTLAALGRPWFLSDFLFQFHCQHDHRQVDCMSINMPRESPSPRPAWPPAAPPGQSCAQTAGARKQRPRLL